MHTKTNDNRFPDLIEVAMRVANSNEEEHRDIRVELRIGSVSLATDDCLEFVVELDRASIALDLDGFEVVPKSRHGEPDKPNDITIDRKISSERTRQAEIAANIEVSASPNPSASGGLKASGSAANKSTATSTAQQTEKLLRVRAKGNLRWEVTEPLLEGGTAPLSDTYLNDDVLCKIKAIPGANLLAAKLDAFARKRDIRVTPLSKLGRFSFKSRNHEIMLNAVIAKALSNDTANGGTLTFSVMEIIVEGD